MSLFRPAVLSALLLAGLQPAIAQEPVLLVSQAEATQPAGAARKLKRASVKPAAAVPAPTLNAYEQALLSVRSGRISEAHDLLRSRLRQTPQDLVACRLLASLLLDSGQLAEAAQVLADGQLQSPQSLDIAMTLARIQADQKAYSAALQTMERSAPHASEDAAYLASMAVLAVQNGQAGRAIPLYQQALRIGPARASWWLALAAAQQSQQDRAGALQSYEMAKAMKQDPKQLRQIEQAIRLLREPRV
jgi:MSHA biogenesis protein MshN